MRIETRRGGYGQFYPVNVVGNREATAQSETVLVKAFCAAAIVIVRASVASAESESTIGPSPYPAGHVYVPR